MTAALDDLDRKILSELLQDAEQSLDEIARKVGSSKTPVWNRIRRMREQGVITRTTAILDAEALGLDFVANPVIGGALTMDNVAAQAKAMGRATGPVFAYCASGNRCSIVWALTQAGARPADDLIGIPARHGYNLEHLRGQLDTLAARMG